MQKDTNEEKVLRFLLNKYQSSKTNRVTFSKNDLQAVDMSEQEVTRALFTLQEDDALTITQKSVHNDLSRFWELALKSNGVHYFEIKDKKRIEINLAYVTSISALISVVISIIALVS